MVLEARGTEHKSRVQIPFSRRIFQPEKFYEIKRGNTATNPAFCAINGIYPYLTVWEV